MDINNLVMEAMQSKSQALPVLKEIKAKFPSNDGKDIADIVKSMFVIKSIVG